MNSQHETTRRNFLQSCATGLSAAGLTLAFPTHGDSGASPAGEDSKASAAAPILRLEADPKRCLVPELSWDTEGGARFHSNLLRKGAGLGLRVRTDGRWRDGAELPTRAQPSGDRTHYSIQVTSQCTLKWDLDVSRDSYRMTLAAEGPETLPPKSVELVFPFDPMVTPTTVLPGHWREDGALTRQSLSAPLILVKCYCV